jgi:hypothetical protein
MNTHRHHHDPHPADLRPLDVAPVAIRPPYDRRPGPVFPYVPALPLPEIRADYLTALTEPLDGITLGAYDRCILTWLAGWDVPTIGAAASLLHRARAAAPLTPGGAR